MKFCPNWNEPGDSVDGQWKRELLRHLGQHCKLKTLIETGTCEGSTCRALIEDFSKIYTVELSDYYFEKSERRLKDFPSIVRYHGDSRIHLPEIIKLLHGEPALFWLDAHSSGGLTADAGDPLPEELHIITMQSPNSLIVIDDMRDEKLQHVTDRGISLHGWTRYYVTGEVIMHRNGQYSLPYFEEGSGG